MRSSNPVLMTDTFQGLSRGFQRTETMTMQGVAFKTTLLLLCVLLSGGWTWMEAMKGNVITGWMMLGAFGGFALALVTAFKKEWAAYTAPIYALLEGFFIGGFSALMEVAYPGLVIQAVMLTLGTLIVLLAVYQSGLIRVTEGFKLGIVAATGGIALVYFVTILLALFGIQVPAIYGSGWVGILFSLVVVSVAALNLVLDFDFIEQGERYGAPKYMEWYGAFALMVTLVWLYVEIVRLLAKFRQERG